jgi:hypothetical protein
MSGRRLDILRPHMIGTLQAAERRRRELSDYPGDRHGVRENAGAAELARLLAVPVADPDETVLTTPYGE